ncbi:DUF4019 domain-containing protein [Pseudoxanthomonas wuyuanensis]|uniref:DUF4019 domain-containing protein n=1 Tax=Pseudoxanthomonas wuyuanensis TaxID=1073196 RepID=UPI00138A32E4|nr:DUF4019 domain-containing protein [Pseudoxanthomonas wuyuanensis]
MISRFPLVLVALLSACTVQVGGSAEDEQVNTGTAVQQEEVRAAARTIAALFDEGRFAESWALAGPVLKSQTSQQEWARHVATLRKPLGAAGKRTIEGFGFPKELDGAPPGEYGLIGVRTDFTNANAVEEKFVFQRVGTEWKLIGYWLSKKVTFGVSKQT